MLHGDDNLVSAALPSLICVIDLRDIHGGSPDIVDQLISQLGKSASRHVRDAARRSLNPLSQRRIFLNPTGAGVRPDHDDD